MISIIVAIAEDNVIGNKGDMPWNLPADLSHFAKVTKGYTVVMGRKTYESIVKKLGHPLKGRKNIVITSQIGFNAPGCTVVQSVEEAVKMLNLENPIGEKVVMFDDPMEVIGVVKNFYYSSPAQKIEPIALTCYRDYPKLIYIRFNSTINKTQATQSVIPVFRQFDPDVMLVSNWSDDIYNAKFNGEKTLSEIIFTSTLLSLLVAILGLLAIHSFTIARRIKEIGIRKVAGSSTGSIVYLLSGNVFLRIGISALIALPITWFIGQHWLEGYSNHIHIGLLLLLIPLAIHTLIAILATFLISYRAATRNPIDALRYE